MTFRRIKKMLGEAVIRSEVAPTNQDVQWIDTVNKILKIFNEETQQWEAVGESIAQTTKLGVIATPTTPKRWEFTIEPTEDFKRSPVEVLSFLTGGQGLVTTLSEFNNGDESSFQNVTGVEFDGTMHLKTLYPVAMTNAGTVGVGQLFSATIDLTTYNQIQRIEVG